MASRRKIKKSQPEVKGRNVDLQRFAYDVFTFSALKFDVLQNCIRKWEGEENDYGHSDFILVLSRMFLHYQITHRNDLYRYFKTRHSSRQFQSFNDVSEILQQVLSLYIKQVGRNTFQELFFSLAVINELIIFLHSENCSLYLKELARFWLEYFTPMKEKFEKDGGLAELYKIYNRPKFDSLDIFYNNFITALCLPYENSTKLDIFYEFHTRIVKYFDDLVKNLPGREKSDYKEVIDEMIRRFQPEVVCAVQIKRSEIDPLENPGLGIPQHEELLRHAGISVAADANSPQNFPGGSCQEPLRRRRGSSSEKKRLRQRRENESWSKLAKNFGKMNLDSSYSEHSTQKEK